MNNIYNFQYLPRSINAVAITRIVVAAHSRYKKTHLATSSFTWTHNGRYRYIYRSTYTTISVQNASNIDYS